MPKRYRDYLQFVDPSAQSGLEPKARLGLRALGISYRSQVEIDGVGDVDLLIGDRLTYDQVMDEWDRVIAVIRALVGRGEHRWATQHHRAGLAQSPGFLQE